MGILNQDVMKFIYLGGKTHKQGVRIMFDVNTAQYVSGYWLVSNRVILVKTEGKPFNVILIEVYAPMTDNRDKDINTFYEDLDTCKFQAIYIVMGNLNAKVGIEQEDIIAGSHGPAAQNVKS